MRSLRDTGTEPDGGGTAICRDALYISFIAIAATILALRFFAISTQFPYHFVWDMDLITTEDCILVHSELTPDTLALPGFGMYLILVTTQRIAIFLGALSPISLGDLAESLNPLACVAELTTFIRLHAPVAAAATVLLLWASVVVLFRPSRSLSVLSFVVLGAQESLVYHVSQGRSELYSILYWSAAVLAVCVAARQKRPARRMASLIVAGVLLGLCFLTKMQALFYLIACPGIFVFALVKEADWSSGVAMPVSRRARGTLFLSGLAALAAFVALLVAAWWIVYPEGKNRWESEFSPWPMAMCVCLVFGAVVAGQFVAWRREEQSAWTALFTYASLMMTGFILAFVLHFAMFADPAISLKYLLYDTKMLFLGQVHSSHKDSVAGLRDFKEFLRYNPALFAIHGLALLALICTAFARGQRRWCLAGSGILLTILALVNIGVAARFIPRDIIWVECLTTFLILSYLLAARANVLPHRRLGTALAAGLMITLGGVEMTHNARMVTRIDGNVNRFAYHSEHWFTNVFGHNQVRFRDVMASRYEQVSDTVYVFGKLRPEPKSTVPPHLLQDPFVAGKQALRHREFRRLVSSVFKNQAISHKHIGLVSERFPVWTQDLGWRVQAFPEDLRYAVVVDSAAVPLRKRYFFDEKYVARGGGHHVLDKFKPDGPRGTAAVLGRPDFRVLLFVGSCDVARAAELDTVTATGESITLICDGSIRTLQALEVMNYAEIPVAGFEGGYFFVLQERERIPPDWEWELRGPAGK